MLRVLRKLCKCFSEKFAEGAPSGPRPDEFPALNVCKRNMDLEQKARGSAKGNGTNGNGATLRSPGLHTAA